MNTGNQRVKFAGTLYTAGGSIWFLTIVGSQLVGFPWSDAHTIAFSIAEVIFIIVQMLLLIGFFGIWWSDGVGQGTFGKIAFGLAGLGHLLFVLVEIHSLIIGELSPLFPLAPVSSAVGILLTGIAVLRAKQWQGWTRWLPLVTGLYPFLFMFPFVATTGETLDVAIGFWGLERLALGLAIRAQADEQAFGAMNPKRLRPFLLTLFCAALVITGLTAIARAQSAPEAVSTTAAQTGSGFTFQGQLQDGGNPVNATCDIQAGLWDAETAGAQVGSTQTVPDVAVANGRFTLTLNAGGQFGATAFNGEARWLQIAVRCPAGSGSYINLQPRQPLMAAPYAHGLVPGVRMETDYVGLWGLQIAMSSDQAHGAIYTQMGDVINTGIQAGIRSDSTFPDVYPIVGQTNQDVNPAILGWNTAHGSGVSAFSSSGNGLYAFSIRGHGVRASTDTGIALLAEDGGFGSLAGVFLGDVTINGVCTGCTQAAFGVNNGRTTLQQGDLVTIESVTSAVYGNAPLLWQVRQAQEGDRVVGVVRGAIQTRSDPETGQEILVPGENGIAPGDLLSITIFGPALVRMDTTTGPLPAGVRITAAANGLARTLQTVEVDGVTLNEAAPILGMALEAGDTDGDGLVWVLVNPH